MIDLDFLGSLTAEAGRAILEIYNTFSTAQKEDRSPFTLADKRSHRIISQGLRSRYPDIPVLSEKEKDVPYSTRMEWRRFWLVDPLDGSEGFIKRNDEFTVNIALIEGGIPVLGAIYLPVQGFLYLAVKGSGCWKIDNGMRHPLKVSTPSIEKPTRVLVGRSHASPDTIALIDLLPSCVTLSRDSALKFCEIAAGEADFYPGLDTTWEWETAAGQAIVTEAGGMMTGLKEEPITYNKPDLLNGPFLAAPSLAWLKEMDVLDYQKRLADSKFELCATSCR